VPVPPPEAAKSKQGSRPGSRPGSGSQLLADGRVPTPVEPDPELSPLLPAPPRGAEAGGGGGGGGGRVSLSRSGTPKIDFEGALDGMVANMYLELSTRNRELRSGFEVLRVENMALLREHGELRQFLLKLCAELESLTADTRLALGQPLEERCPTPDEPGLSACLETENARLAQASTALGEANARIREENEKLRSEASARSPTGLKLG